MGIRAVLFFIALGCCAIFGADMVSIPAGPFTMGSDNTRDVDEKPAHTVQLTSFALDKYEVSRAEYDRCVAAGACTEASYSNGKCLAWSSQGIKKVIVPQHYQSPDLPVVCVTWQQAQEYCRSKGKRLPTEAEWEKAALAGGTSLYSWGNGSPSASNTALPKNGSPVKPGTFPPNALGLHDMTGNVWEWVSDKYERDYYQYSPESDPPGSPASRFRVIRGGGWYSSAEQLRIKNRQWFTPESAEISVGFRCAK